MFSSIDGLLKASYLAGNFDLKFGRVWESCCDNTAAVFVEDLARMLLHTKDTITSNPCFEKFHFVKFAQEYLVFSLLLSASIDTWMAPILNYRPEVSFHWKSRKPTNSGQRPPNTRLHPLLLLEAAVQDVDVGRRILPKWTEQFDSGIQASFCEIKSEDDCIYKSKIQRMIYGGGGGCGDGEDYDVGDHDRELNLSSLMLSSTLASFCTKIVTGNSRKAVVATEHLFHDGWFEYEILVWWKQGFGVSSFGLCKAQLQLLWYGLCCLSISDIDRLPTKTQS
ncbi:hypothetical protein L1987_77819 [Smallanthus sonchifolius]|uniref:Uncharacterized protein n=1 Tax=Smallanthus sonchifolius TaxID=185202 RepID=A0ACB8ZB54_9ASTR|nr:hypothetical protein L1987_77819 [Smallanthus sonchifolius]